MQKTEHSKIQLKLLNPNQNILEIQNQTKNLQLGPIIFDQNNYNSSKNEQNQKVSFKQQNVSKQIKKESLQQKIISRKLLSQSYSSVTINGQTYSSYSNGNYVVNYYNAPSQNTNRESSYYPSTNTYKPTTFSQTSYSSAVYNYILPNIYNAPKYISNAPTYQSSSSYNEYTPTSYSSYQSSNQNNGLYSSYYDSSASNQYYQQSTISIGIGTIVGLSVGALIFIGFIIAIIVICVKKNRTQQNDQEIQIAQSRENAYKIEQNQSVTNPIAQYAEVSPFVNPPEMSIEQKPSIEYTAQKLIPQIDGDGLSVSNPPQGKPIQLSFNTQQQPIYNPQDEYQPQTQVLGPQKQIADINGPDYPVHQYIYDYQSVLKNNQNQDIMNVQLQNFNLIQNHQDIPLKFNYSLNDHIERFDKDIQ